MTKDNPAPTATCPRTFTDSNKTVKTIYCAKWTCPRCAQRKLRRLAAQSAATAQSNAPLYLLTLRAPRLTMAWNRLTQRIRRPYIGAIEHKPDLHIHAIIQKPPRDTAEIWKSLGGTYFNITPVHEFPETLAYCTKTLTEDFTESRLIKSRDWTLAPLAQALNEAMQQLKDRTQSQLHTPSQHEPAPIPEKKTSSTKTAEATKDILTNIIAMLPEGTEITFTIKKG